MSLRSALGLISKARLAAAIAAQPGIMTLMGTRTVGETAPLLVALGIRRYTVALPGVAVGDKIVMALTGAPQNGTLQDVYVSSAGNLNVGLLVPALGLGTVIAVPLAFYKIS